MLYSTDQSKVKIIQSFLEEISYKFVYTKIVGMGNDDVFPDFEETHRELKRYRNLYRLFFSIFLLGHSAEEFFLRKLFPKEIYDIFVEIGLLVNIRKNQWKTPSIAIVPVEGLYLAVSLPPKYPTASDLQQEVYIGPDSIWTARSLPSRLNDKNVLDICSGSGILGLICAARGASSVTCLEKNEVAVNLSRFNIALNGFNDRVAVHKSDVYEQLGEEKFDFIVSNPPFLPVSSKFNFPMAGNGGEEGATVIRQIFGSLKKYLSENGEGIVFCDTLGSQFTVSLNKNLLSNICVKDQLTMRAYIADKIPFDSYITSLKKNMKVFDRQLSDEEIDVKINNWKGNLSKSNIDAQFIYGQIIKIWNNKSPNFSNLPIYNPILSDPLMKYTQINNPS